MAEYTAGLVGGMVGSAFIHPIDSLRVISQRNMNNSLQQSLQQVYKNGLRAGLLPALVTQSLMYSLLFGTQEYVHSFVVEMTASREKTILSSALAGSITEALISPLTCPLEVIKCRKQAGKLKTPPAMLFRGLLATMMRCSLGNAAFFACIYYLGSGEKREESEQGFDLNVNGKEALIGAVSGIAYWSVATPFDLIKNRQQTHPSSSPVPSVLQEARNAMKERGMGLRTFWRGFDLAIARTVPMQAVVMMSYCACLRFLRSMSDK